VCPVYHKSPVSGSRCMRDSDLWRQYAVPRCSISWGCPSGRRATLWEFPAIRITDKIEQAQASSPVCISASLHLLRLLLRIVLRQIDRALVKIGMGAWRIALLPRLGERRLTVRQREKWLDWGGAGRSGGTGGVLLFLVFR
jgi:hypothetical protein